MPIDKADILGYNKTMELEKYNFILKLNQIFKKGYVPSRGAKDYFALHNGSCIAEYINCFGHACFNLTDELIKMAQFSYHEAGIFFNILGNEVYSNGRKVCDKMFNFVRETGLSVDECGLYDQMRYNQWKVAFYIDKGGDANNVARGDIHFMLQEKDGKWSSKMGTAKTLQYFRELQRVFFCDYDLYGIYKITNPYVESERESQLLLQA